MFILSRPDSESGQTMAEYSVVLGALILAVITVIGVLGTAIANRLGPAAATIAGLVT
jgi:Flp pilus assembly pilin Flp